MFSRTSKGTRLELSWMWMEERILRWSWMKAISEWFLEG